jgi:hypothetical protein
VRGRLLLLDATAIVLFAVVGLLSHDGTVSPAGLARDALPVLGCWLAAAAALGLYRGGGLRRLLATWAVGVPLGVLVRALALGRGLDGSQAAFLGTSLAFVLVFVLGLRALARAASRLY